MSRLNLRTLINIMTCGCAIAGLLVGCDWIESQNPLPYRPHVGICTRVSPTHAITALHILKNHGDGEDLWVMFPEWKGEGEGEAPQTGPRGSVVDSMYYNTFFSPFLIDLAKDGWAYRPTDVRDDVEVFPFQRRHLDSIGPDEGHTVTDAHVFAARRVVDGKLLQLHATVGVGGSDPEAAARYDHQRKAASLRQLRGVISADCQFIGRVNLGGKDYYKSEYTVIGAWSKRQTQQVYRTFHAGFTLTFMIAYSAVDGYISSAADGLIANAVTLLASPDIVTDTSHYLQYDRANLNVISTGKVSPQTRHYRASVVAKDPENDLALLKLESGSRPPPEATPHYLSFDSRRELSKTFGTILGHFFPVSLDGQSPFTSSLWDERELTFGEYKTQESLQSTSHETEEQKRAARRLLMKCQGDARSRDALSASYRHNVTAVGLLAYNIPRERANAPRAKPEGSRVREIAPGFIWGFSGSPVFDDIGNPAGIYSSGSFHPNCADWTGQVIPNAEIRRFLIENSVNVP